MSEHLSSSEKAQGNLQEKYNFPEMSDALLERVANIDTGDGIHKHGVDELEVPVALTGGHDMSDQARTVADKIGWLNASEENPVVDSANQLLGSLPLQDARDAVMAGLTNGASIKGSELRAVPIEIGQAATADADYARSCVLERAMFDGNGSVPYVVEMMSTFKNDSEGHVSELVGFTAARRHATPAEIDERAQIEALSRSA